VASAGIYIIKGDTIPIQIIDSRELSEEENLWLKDLDNRLDAQRLQRLDAAIDRCGNADQMRAYLDIIARANPDALEDAVKMSKSTKTLEQVFVNVGWTAKWENSKALEIARNMLIDGDSPAKVARNTGLPLAEVKALLKTTTVTQPA
jgi:DNA-binding transcriptional MerR regulator